LASPTACPGISPSSKAQVRCGKRSNEPQSFSATRCMACRNTNFKHITLLRRQILNDHSLQQCLRRPRGQDWNQECVAFGMRLHLTHAVRWLLSMIHHKAHHVFLSDGSHVLKLASRVGVSKSAASCSKIELSLHITSQQLCAKARTQPCTSCIKLLLAKEVGTQVRASHRPGWAPRLLSMTATGCIESD
jgi:hypothetical protein